MSSASGSDASGEDPQLYLDYYQANQLSIYIASAGFAFLFFEYSITLDRELCYLRDHKRTWAKMIFVLNRYMSLVKAFATLLSAVLPVSTFSCVFLGRTIDVLQISLFAVWAVFSSLRVYALSNNVRVIVGLVGLLSSAPVITFTYVAFTTYYEIDIVPYAPYPEICTMYYSIAMSVFQEFGLLTHIPLVLAEALVVAVTFMRIWNVALGRNESPIVQVPRLILKEGVLYFLAMLLVNSTQIISDFLFDPHFAAACNVFILLVPILVSRFYLNLHDVRKAEDQRKAEEMASNLEKTKALRMSKPLPPVPGHEFEESKICYLNEVFQYNSQVLGRGAARA